jgi:hypothetical protein
MSSHNGPWIAVFSDGHAWRAIQNGRVQTVRAALLGPGNGG